MIKIIEYVIKNTKQLKLEEILRRKIFLDCLGITFHQIFQKQEALQKMCNQSLFIRSTEKKLEYTVQHAI